MANGRLYAAEIVDEPVRGPPLGALLFGAAAAAPFFLDAASFGLAAVLILLLRGSFRPVRPRGGRARRSAPTSPRACAGSSGTASCARSRSRSAIINFVDAATIAILVLYALEVLGLPNAGYGLLLTAGGVGALLGSVVAGAAEPARSVRARILVGSVLVHGRRTARPGPLGERLGGGRGVGADRPFGVAWNVVTVSLRQSIVPDELLGRVNSAYRLVGSGTMPIGALLGGVLADAFGLRAPFLIAGTIYIAMVPLLTRILSTQRSSRKERCQLKRTSGRPVPGGSVGRPLVRDVD